MSSSTYAPGSLGTIIIGANPLQTILLRAAVVTTAEGHYRGVVGMTALAQLFAAAAGVALPQYTWDRWRPRASGCR